MNPTSAPAPPSRRGEPMPALERPPRRARARELGAAGWLSLRFLLVAGAVAVLAYVLVRLSLVVLPLLLATIAAAALAPAVNWLERRHVHRGLGAGAAVLGLLLAVGGTFALIGPAFVNGLDDVDFGVRRGLGRLVSMIVEGPFDITRVEVDRALDDAWDQLRHSAGSITGSVLGGALLAAHIVSGILLGIVSLFFLLKDGERIWGWLLDRLPERHHGRGWAVGRRSLRVLGGYVRGLLVIAVVDSVLIGLALWIIGVPLVLPLAALTFFAAFFPIVGAFTAGLAAVLVALVAVGPVAALLVAAAIVVVQQVEGNVLYPLVVGRRVSLHPLAILLALTAGAVLLGVAGAFLAVPLLAVANAARAVIAETRRELPLATIETDRWG